MRLCACCRFISLKDSLLTGTIHTAYRDGQRGCRSTKARIFPLSLKKQREKEIESFAWDAVKCSKLVLGWNSDVRRFPLNVFTHHVPARKWR